MIDKELIGLLAVALTFAGYIPYFWSILKRSTTPHMFSWVIWGTVNGIVFVGQYSAGGGAGSWVAGTTSVLCFLIVALCFRYGEKNIKKSDWIALIAAFLAIPLWYFTKNPLWAVILATMIDVVGCYPTARKSFNNPYNENLMSWAIAALRSFISFFALEAYSLTTVIFPIAMIFTNGGMAAMLAWRRVQLGKKAS